VTSDFIAYLFQSREVSCLEVQVDETKTKSSDKSEVIDLNRLSLLFVLWKMKLNLDKYMIHFSVLCLYQGCLGIEVFP